ncbi:MAG: hypothetical protein ABI408_03465 [Gemmatimonadaceae bacterium]
MQRVMVGMLTLATMGCYTVEPLITASRPGQELVVQISDAGTSQLAQYLGPGISVINGRFIAAADDTLKVAVSSTETRKGDVHFWQGEEISVARNLIATLSEKKVSPSRSFLAAGAAIIGAALIKVGFGGSGSSGKTTLPPAGQ